MIAHNRSTTTLLLLLLLPRRRTLLRRLPLLPQHLCLPLQERGFEPLSFLGFSRRSLLPRRNRMLPLGCRLIYDLFQALQGARTKASAASVLRTARRHVSLFTAHPLRAQLGSIRACMSPPSQARASVQQLSLPPPGPAHG